MNFISSEYANDHYLHTLNIEYCLFYFFLSCDDTFHVAYNQGLSNLKNLILKEPISLI